MTYREVWHEMWEALKDFCKPTEVAETYVPAYFHLEEKPVQNATVTPRPDLGLCMTSVEVPTWNLCPMPESDKKLWVYNVSKVAHTVDHPMMGSVTIPANTTRKRYSMWTSFPDTVMGVNYNIDTNERSTYPIHGEYFVEDLINPDCHGFHPGLSSNQTAIGRDLSFRGVFWSYRNPPKPSEVTIAVKKLKNYYADLLERMAILYASAVINEKTVRRIMQEEKCSLDDALIKARVISVQGQLTPEHHAACECFKTTTPWHPVLRG